MPLDVGDVRVDYDNTAIARFSFADLIPGAIASLEDDRLAWITVLGDTLAYPLFRVLLGCRNEAIPYRAPDDALELVSDFDRRAGVMPHQLAVMRIAQDQSILVVVKRKAFRDGFNRFQETLSGERYLLFAEFEVSDVTACAAVASEFAISPKNRFAADLQIPHRTIRHRCVVSKISKRSVRGEFGIMLFPMRLIEFAAGKFLTSLADHLLRPDGKY